MDTPLKGKILVMDDQVHMRELFQDVLNQLGYEACTAAEGTEAVKIYQEALQSEHPFHAVILDLTIANGMDGRTTLKELLQIDREVKAIATSGVSIPITDESMCGFQAILSKPYAIAELNRLLEEILNTSI